MALDAHNLSWHFDRSNLSISPEESWLPIASIVLGVIHIQVQRHFPDTLSKNVFLASSLVCCLLGYFLWQLEASIRSGDLDSFNLFNEAAKRLGLVKKHSGAEDLQELYKEVAAGLLIPNPKVL